MDTSASLTLETEHTNIITDAASSTSIGTVPMNTALMSTHTPTSETWLSTNSVTNPSVPDFTSLRLTTTISSSRPSAMMTSSTCDNGGTWEQGQCLCLPGFSGDHCEFQIQCQNGGRWNGFKCQCPSTFYGSHCEFAVEQVDLDTVEAEVTMEVAVDQDFSPDLRDNTSKAYRDFSNAFQDQMQSIYQNVQGFKGVEILSLRNGSIVVDYLVLLELSFSLQLESEYEKVKTALKEELQNASQDEAGCSNNQTLCFKPDSIKVNNTTRTELTPEAICSRVAAVGYEAFYFPLVEEKRLRCVTKCTSGVDGAFDCHQGQCLLERSGPACRYWDQDRKWFEIWDEDTVGTFSSTGSENDRIGKHENFHVALENVDTNVRVQVQRPEVAGSLH
ncbi:mucin-3B [Tupaia chinensis]|uniref:mucin-3B n=1 Tax=Tupaia chinensis TaxID=246437 RepID=UPI000FFC3D5E|nr:mucin-3B [Tupaia chinensis]